MPRLLIFLLIVLTAPAVAHPQDEPARVTLEELFTGDGFDGDDVPAIRWLEAGRHYTVLEPSEVDLPRDESDPEPQDLVRYETESGKRRVLVSARQLIPAGHSQPLSIDDYHFSDDATRLLLFTNSERVWRRRTRGDYWVLHLKKGQLVRLGQDAEPSSLMFAHFSPDGHRVAYVYQRNLYVESAAGGDIVQLTHDGSETVINGTFDWVYEEELSLYDGFRWSPDGERIAYWQLDTSGIGTFHLIDNTAGLYPRLKSFPYPKVGTTNSSSRIGVVSTQGGETRWLSDYDDPRQHYLARLEWAGDSRTLAVQHLNRAQNTLSVLLGDADSQGDVGSYRTIHIERDEAWLDPVDAWTWIDGGRRFVWISERDGWRHVYVVPRDGQESQSKLLTPGDFDVIEVLAVDEDAGVVDFIASPESPAERYLYRVPLDGSAAPERLTPADQRGSHSYDIAPGGAWAVHRYSRFGVPPVVDLVRLPEHESRRVLASNAGLRQRVEALDRGEARFFQVTIDEDVTLDGWEMRPPDFDAERRYPVLFFVYGEPWGQTVQDTWGGQRYLWHLMLTQRGYLVMSVDNRGTPAPRGRAFRKALFKQVGVLSSVDQAAAARRIFEWPHVDAGRVGIWGWSGGGSMTLNMLFRYPEMYHTGISVAPVPDQRLYDTIYQERYQGLPEENPDVYDEGSPLTFAEHLEGNLLLVHGTGDDNVHYQGMEKLIDKLIAHNKAFTMMAYPNRSHGISEGEGTRRHLYELMTRFLEEHLPADPKATESLDDGVRRQESAWSSDGTQIVYWSDLGENREICSVSPDGTNLRNLTRHPREDANGVFSPDGTRIAYFSRLDRDGQIFIAHTDGSEPVNISDGQWGDYNPSWSPDGQRIAFHSMRDGDFDIFSMKVDGTDVRPLTINDTNDTNPAFSPDGERLAFVAHRHSTTEIYVLNLKTGKEQRLTRSEKSYRNPKWSPDGKKIVCHTDELRDGVDFGTVVLMSADGADQRVLVDHDSYNFNPFFSPDGRWIAFASTRGGEIGLYKIRPDGTDETMITPGFCHESP